MHTTMKVKYHIFDKEGNEIGDDTLIKDEKLLDFLASIYCGVYEQGSGKLATTIVNDLIKMTKSQKDKDGYYTFGQANIFYQNYIGKLILGNYRTESGAGGYLEDIYLNTNEFKEINFYYNFDNYIHGVDQTSVEFVPDNKGGGEYVVKYDVNILPRNLNATAKGKYKIILDNISTYKSQTLSIVPNNEKIKKENEFAFEIPDNLHDDTEVQFTATKISEPNGYTDEDTANNLFKVNIK